MRLITGIYFNILIAEELVILSNPGNAYGVAYSPSAVSVDNLILFGCPDLLSDKVKKENVK